MDAYDLIATKKNSLMAVKNRLTHLKEMVEVPSIFVYKLDSKLIDKVFPAQQKRLCVNMRHHLLNTYYFLIRL